MATQTPERSFDELTRGLASGTLSRGRAIRLMGAALVGGTLASLGIGEAAADPSGCKRNGKKCKTDDQCCSGNCEGGTCADAPPMIDVSCICSGGPSGQEIHLACLSECPGNDTVFSDCTSLCAENADEVGSVYFGVACRPDSPVCVEE